MVNTAKLLFKKKSFIIIGIVSPAIVIVFFSFAFGSNMNYKVGIIDKDNSYISKDIIDVISNIEDIDIVDIEKDNYEMLLASHQIQIDIIIEKNFSNNLLNLEDGKITIKSISNSDIKETLVSMIKSKVNNLSLIAKISDKNIEKFKEINEGYKENLFKVNLNEAKESRPAIENSIGIVIMMILISGATIANFLIEKEPLIMDRFTWKEILNKNRIRDYKSAKKNLDCRDEFENDYDRILFSASFRRLQDKAQVFLCSLSLSRN